MNFVSTPVRAAACSLLASVSLSASFSVSAQTATLKETVVTASRFEQPILEAPAAIQVITQADIKNSGAVSVPDVLMMLGGVNVRSVAGGQLGLNSAVDLGGFGATATNNTLVLLDGRRLNPIDSSDIAWSVIPMSAIERIEIASGAYGVQYGDGATGGVINIITNSQSAPSNAVQFTAGSFGTQIGNVTMANTLGDTQVLLNAGASRSDGWRENSQAQSQNLSLKAKKSLRQNSLLMAEVFAADQTQGFAGGVSQQVGLGDPRAVRFNNVGSQSSSQSSGLRLGAYSSLSAGTILDIELVMSRKDSKLTRPYYDTPDSFNVDFGVVSGAGLIRSSGDQIAFSPKIKKEFDTGASIVWGYDYAKVKQDGVSAYGAQAKQFILNNQGYYQGNVVQESQNVQLLNQSIYLIGKLPLASDLDMNLGVRRQVQAFDTSDTSIVSGQMQTSSGTFVASAHELGLTRKLDETRRTYLRINQSYRFANTDEFWGFDAMGNRTFSGALKPQLTQAYQIGYDQRRPNQQFGIYFNQSVTRDEIRYDPSVYQNANLVDPIFRTALGFSLNHQLSMDTQLMASARFQRAEFLTGQFSGQTPGMIPSSVYNLGFVKQLDIRTRAGLQITHVSKQNYEASPDAMPRLDQMPAYTTADIFWIRNYNKFETKVVLKNIANQSYASYGGYGGVQVPGGNTSSSYYHYPSDPRALMISAIYKF